MGEWGGGEGGGEIVKQMSHPPGDSCSGLLLANRSKRDVSGRRNKAKFFNPQGNSGCLGRGLGTRLTLPKGGPMGAKYFLHRKERVGSKSHTRRAEKRGLIYGTKTKRGRKKLPYGPSKTNPSYSFYQYSRKKGKRKHSVEFLTTWRYWVGGGPGGVS